MYRKRAVFSAGLLILIISISAANLFAQVQVSAQVSNSIYVDPAEVAGVPVGGSFSIGVNAFGVSGVNALEIRLGYDTSILDCTGTSEGSFLPSGGITFYSYVIDEAMGIVMISSLLLDPLATVSGDGVLSNIAFTVTNEGSSVLDIGLWNSGPGEPHNWLLGIGGSQIVHESSNGVINPEVAKHDVAVTAIIASPSPATVGDLVSIDVDVDNLGNFGEPVDVTVTVDGTTFPTESVSLPAKTSATIPYDWDTTGVDAGEYTITATATIPIDEVPINNERTATINLVPVQKHDVEVTTLTVPGTATVGDSVTVTVMVTNLGNFLETVDITVTADPGAILIGSDLGLSLAAGDSTTQTYNWDTTDLTAGDYTITATATIPIDDVPGNNEQTATINLKESTAYHATLVSRSAWPEHHNYRLLRDEDEYNTLWGKVKNDGTEATSVRVQFTIDGPGAFDLVENSDPIPLQQGASDNVHFDFPCSAAPKGKYYVTAICQFKDALGNWVDSTIKVKTFSFAIRV